MRHAKAQASRSLASSVGLRRGLVGQGYNECLAAPNHDRLLYRCRPSRGAQRPLSYGSSVYRVYDRQLWPYSRALTLDLFLGVRRRIGLCGAFFIVVIVVVSALILIAELDFLFQELPGAT